MNQILPYGTIFLHPCFAGLSRIRAAVLILLTLRVGCISYRNLCNPALVTFSIVAWAIVVGDRERTILQVLGSWTSSLFLVQLTSEPGEVWSQTYLFCLMLESCCEGPNPCMVGQITLSSCWQLTSHSNLGASKDHSFSIKFNRKTKCLPNIAVYLYSKVPIYFSSRNTIIN